MGGYAIPESWTLSGTMEACVSGIAQANSTYACTQFKRAHICRTTTTSTTQAPSTTNNDDVYLYRGKNTIIANIEQVALIIDMA